MATEKKVFAVAEGEVFIAAIGVEALWLGEHLRVVIGGAEDPIPGGDTDNKPRLVCKQAIFPADRGTTENSPSAVPKVSLANGLIYLYTRDPGNDPALQAWYFTAVDFETGKLVYKVLTGIGPGYNNHYGSMTLAQDGTMVVGVLQGVVSVSDGGGAAKP